MVTLDYAIDTVMQLKPQQREMLIDIIRKREIERRREEIAQDAQKSIAAFHAGELKPQPMQDIIFELRSSLNERDEE